jgi:hypothetical protein
VLFGVILSAFAGFVLIWRSAGHRRTRIAAHAPQSGA